jgi:hypothetical protein
LKKNHKFDLKGLKTIGAWVRQIYFIIIIIIIIIIINKFEKNIIIIEEKL